MDKKTLPDTPWSLGYAKKEERDPRRHKSRCMYFMTENVDVVEVVLTL